MPSGSPVSVRPTHRPYAEYLQQQDQDDKSEIPEGPKLVRQMFIGFSCAALFGLIMLVIGSVFIGDAIKSKYAITIMLCVMGIGKCLSSSCYMGLTKDLKGKCLNMLSPLCCM